jgi:hypothetical protein
LIYPQISQISQIKTKRAILYWVVTYSWAVPRQMDSNEGRTALQFSTCHSGFSLPDNPARANIWDSGKTLPIQ